jgi:hypothetical protein
MRRTQGHREEQMTAGYEFDGGFPTPGTVQRAYDEADLNRAVQCYRLFFASVSGLAIFKGNEVLGLVDNEVFGTLETQPKHVGLTLNSDTPYAPLLLDLQAGPMVIELPPGPLICIAMDLNQRWVMDMGLPGPDAGQGGRHLLLPPYQGDVPEGYFVGQSSTFRVLAGIRALPIAGAVHAASERLTTVKVRPLDPGRDWREPTYIDLTPRPQDTTPDRWEERMRSILQQAAVIGNAQMRAQSFADRRPPTADRTASCGPAGNGSGPLYALRTVISTEPVQ